MFQLADELARSGEFSGWCEIEVELRSRGYLQRSLIVGDARTPREAFNRVRVDRADNVLTCAVINDVVRIVVQAAVAGLSSVASKLTLCETASWTKACKRP